MEQPTTRSRMQTRVFGRLAAAAAMAVVMALVVGAGTARAQETASVSIVDFAFDSGTITVEVGTTVTWTNTGNAPHTVTANDGAFDSGTLNNGGTYSFTFDTPGTYSYFCAIHPSMTASVVVTGAADDDGDAGAATTVPNTGVGPTALHDSTSLLLALAGAAGVLIVLAVRQRRVA